MSEIKQVGQMIKIHPDYENIVTHEWFEKSYWQKQNKITGEPDGGRGGACFFKDNNMEFVLRHYQRGGQMAKISNDKFLFTGINKARGFVEFKLHNTLFDNRLPVAKPVAVRIIKRGLFYTADYISEKIQNAQTFCEHLKYTPDPHMIELVYKTIERFHRFGLNHRDLNVHNILIVKNGVYLLDFDKCDLNATKKTKKSNLTRLSRSIHKEHLNF